MFCVNRSCSNVCWFALLEHALEPEEGALFNCPEEGLYAEPAKGVSFTCHAKGSVWSLKKALCLLVCVNIFR